MENCCSSCTVSPSRPALREGGAVAVPLQSQITVCQRTFGGAGSQDYKPVYLGGSTRMVCRSTTDQSSPAACPDTHSRFLTP